MAFLIQGILHDLPSLKAPLKGDKREEERSYHDEDQENVDDGISCQKQGDDGGNESHQESRKANKHDQGNQDGKGKRIVGDAPTRGDTLNREGDKRQTYT